MPIKQNLSAILFKLIMHRIWNSSQSYQSFIAQPNVHQDGELSPSHAEYSPTNDELEKCTTKSEVLKENINKINIWTKSQVWTLAKSASSKKVHSDRNSSKIHSHRQLQKKELDLKPQVKPKEKEWKMTKSLQKDPIFPDKTFWSKSTEKNLIFNGVPFNNCKH